jgi:LemA protein
LLIVAGYIVMTYNTLIAQIEATRNNQKQIDIQLDRRFKVFQSLIEVVKKYMDYEQTTLKDVVALRNKAQTAQASGDEQTRINAENQISKIASGINVVFEQYP